MRTILIVSAFTLLLLGCGDNTTTITEKEPAKTVQNTPEPPTTKSVDTTAEKPTPTNQAASWQGVKEINDAAFTEKIMNNPGVTIVDFNATWCGPCKALKPIFEKAATDFAGKASFASMDVDQNPVVSQLYNIQSIPLLLFFKKGKIINKIVGLPAKNELYAAIEKAIK